jgi:hypothetical protein
MKKLILVLLLTIFATAQTDDWHTCAEAIIKIQDDVIKFGVQVQETVEGTLIPDV